VYWARQFWEQVEAKGLLAQDALILAGDLNFSTSIDEVWGEVALSDPLADFFKNLFANNQLVDVMPAVLMPTWRNGRRGVEEIQKRLDRVYVSEALLSEAARYRSWVELPFISDHAPVILQLDYGYKPVAYPYKFNPACLKEESFCDLVRVVWGTQQEAEEVGAQRRLARKLSKLKSQVKIWLADRNKRNSYPLKILKQRSLSSLSKV
jgi:hypothetical protein